MTFQIFERETRKEKNLEASKKLAELKNKVVRENIAVKDAETKKRELLKKCENEFYALIGNTENDEVDKLQEEEISKMEKDNKSQINGRQDNEKQLKSEEKKVEEPKEPEENKVMVEEEDEKKLERKTSDKQAIDRQKSDRTIGNNVDSRKDLEVKKEETKQ